MDELNRYRKTLAVVVKTLAVVVNTLAVVVNTLAVVDDTLAVTDKKNVVIFGLFKAIPENLKMELKYVEDVFLTLGNLLLFSCEAIKLLILKQYEVKGNTITSFNRL